MDALSVVSILRQVMAKKKTNAKVTEREDFAIEIDVEDESHLLKKSKKKSSKKAAKKAAKKKASKKKTSKKTKKKAKKK